MPQGEANKQSSGACLNETDLSADPFTQFRLWLQEAADAGLKEPGAMTLATSTPEGIPSARVVLLREHLVAQDQRRIEVRDHLHVVQRPVHLLLVPSHHRLRVAQAEDDGVARPTFGGPFLLITTL